MLKVTELNAVVWFEAAGVRKIISFVQVNAFDEIVAGSFYSQGLDDFLSLELMQDLYTKMFPGSRVWLERRDDAPELYRREEEKPDGGLVSLKMGVMETWKKALDPSGSSII
jgi:hypothetical protein